MKQTQGPAQGVLTAPPARREHGERAARCSSGLIPFLKTLQQPLTERGIPSGWSGWDCKQSSDSLSVTLKVEGWGGRTLLSSGG